MKNYIVTLSGEIKEATIIAQTPSAAQLEYYEFDGPKRCMRSNTEIYRTKTEAKKHK